MGPELTVAMYHYVRPLKETRYPEIKGLDLVDFENHIKYLQKKYHLITIEQLDAYYSNNEKIPDQSCLLTFDDGYRDHFDYVFPILHKHKIQGSFYAPIQTIKGNLVLDVNKIHFLLAATTDKNILVKEILDFVNQHKDEHQLLSAEEYFQKVAVANRFDPKEVIFIKRMLQIELPELLRNKLTNKLFIEHLKMDDATFRNELYMNMNQVKEMIQNGMHFGAHGNTHCWLSRLNYQDQLNELIASKNFLINDCQMKLLTLSYPYGMYNEDTLKISNELGFKLAFTTQFKKATLSNENPLLMPRWDAVDISQEIKS